MTANKFRYTTVMAVVIANMIGTGVFTSLGFQLLDIRSGFVLLMLWAVGGLTAVCGAMTYAELGAAMPRSGGEYNFLSRIYHRNRRSVHFGARVTQTEHAQRCEARRLGDGGGSCPRGNRRVQQVQGEDSN